MTRQVNSTQPYQDKMVKLIPTEIVGAYLVLAGILGFGASSSPQLATLQSPSEPELKVTLIQVVFFVLLVLTPIYLRKISRVTNTPQIIITTLSFVIWVYTLGGPFVVWNVYYPLIGSVVLVMWSLIIPLFVPTR